MKVLSLFANVGFGEYYFDSNGFDVVVANELLDDRVEFYKKFNSNSTNLITGDIAEQIIKNNIISSCLQHGNIDLIMATPPCQGMSIANAQKDKDDVRNTLIVHAMEVFNKIKPKYMLIENVPQMGKTFINYEGETINILKFIKSQLPDGFECHCKVLNAKNFGTAQSRSRTICLISKNGEWQHPKSFDELITVRDVIDDFSKFPALNQSENSDEWDIPWHFAPKHNAKHVEWMTNTGTGNTYKRMEWDSPAPTVTMTNGSISSQNNVHPGRKYVDGTYSDARVLTIRELLAICGLPIDCLDKFAKKEDDGSYKYDYSPNFIRKVIGEMFLPRMALSIVKPLQDL